MVEFCDCSSKRCQDAASIIGKVLACELQNESEHMMNTLPISPITGEPSKLRALVERSVRGPGLRPGVVVRVEADGVSTVTYDPARARGALAPGLLPGAQLSQRAGVVSPHDAVRGVRPRPPVTNQPALQQAAPDMSELRSALDLITGELARFARDLSATLDAAMVSRRPTVQQSQPARPVALNTGQGVVPLSYNQAVVARSLGVDAAVPAPGRRLPNAVEIYEADKLALLKRNGVW